MNIEKVLLLILIVHYLADFIIQTDWQAKNKSTDIGALSLHVFTYSYTWLLALGIVNIWWNMAIPDMVLFCLITFIAHWCTDFITSRIGKIFWDKKDVRHGFMIVGFDQMLHYVQLYLTYKLVLGL